MNNQWLAPARIYRASADDQAVDEEIRRRTEVEAKALEAGLSMEEIKLLRK